MASSESSRPKRSRIRRELLLFEPDSMDKAPEDLLRLCSEAEPSDRVSAVVSLVCCAESQTCSHCQSADHYVRSAAKGDTA